MTTNIENKIRELQENGYTIINNVYNQNEIDEYKEEFFKWYNNIENLDYLHKTIHVNGIFKLFEIGQQRFCWLARTNEKILSIFKQLWNTDELVVSFDGCCYYPKDYIGENRYWTHTDQSPQKKGLHCYQSFLSLTNNKERTLLLYKGSHKLHEDYFITMEIDDSSDWHILDKNYVQELAEDKILLHVKAGDLVIWDSRTFHQNTCGDINCKEERLIQYLCYLPKYGEGNNEKEKHKRRNYYKTIRTTSHWPYPMNVVPKQPNHYNYYYPENKIFIDYDSLAIPDLDDLREQIENLL